MKSILTVYTPLGVVVLVKHANTGSRPPDQRGCLYWIGVVKVVLKVPISANDAARFGRAACESVNQPRLDGR